MTKHFLRLVTLILGITACSKQTSPEELKNQIMDELSHENPELLRLPLKT
jgi:hypothetical protein